LKIEGGEVGRTQTRAFMLGTGPLTLGVKLGVLVEFKETFIYDHMGAKGPDAVDAWRNTELEPIEVTPSLTPDRARAYSGLDDAGPTGLLLGVGALGSTMLDFWSRSGWGLWTLVDNDYLKPHNYVRHAAIPARVGQYKVNAMAEMDALVYGLEQPRFVAVASDAWGMDIEALKKLGPTDLIIDATTTLEVPRRLSGMDGAQRCISVFVTPNGQDGVMLAEDKSRSIRLDALECQYYRAILHSSWGAEHVADATPKIRSGAGCRDVSLTLPYSVIAGHASVLAEQVQALHSNEAPRIAVWRRDQDSGQTKRFDIELHAPIRQEDKELGLSILWDEGLRRRLYELRAKSLPSETGGILLGYHDLNEGRIYLVDVVEAPADSRGTPSSFERGIQGLSDQVDDVQRLTGKVVGYLGEWHSHPPGYRSDPSRDDIWQALYLGEVLRQDGLPGIMLIVGDPDLTFLVAR
jgi:integrative and conjugative element protein (TIGR02256 family)